MDKDLTIDIVIDTTCAYFDIDVDTIHKVTRKREIVQSRQIAQAISYEILRKIANYEYIGKKIGGKNHSTVIHACKTVTNLYDTDRDFRNNYDELYSRILRRLNIPNMDYSILKRNYDTLKDIKNQLHKIAYDDNSDMYLNKDLCQSISKMKVSIISLENAFSKFREK